MEGEMTRLEAGASVGCYVLVERIGDPNMGDVWRAHHADNPQARVAVKCISPQLRSNPVMMERFSRECAVQARLQHPHIVPVLEWLHTAGDLFLVMPLIAGGSLEDFIVAAKGKPLPAGLALQISLQVLDALNYAHEKGVIHRDVKPSNILLENGRAYLADFGIAYLIGMSARQQSESSGTVPYMSPEQIVAPAAVGHWSDVYGFGCVLYEMLTGRPPFPLEAHDPCTNDQIKFMHLQTAPIPPRALNPLISEQLERVMLTALAKAPQQRFSGCSSFAGAIRAVMLQTSPGAPSPAPSAAPASAAPVRRASAAAYLGVLFGGYLVFTILFAVALSLGAGEEMALALFMVGCALLALIVEMRLVYRSWSAIQDPATRIQPVSAAVLLLIPGFNLLWLAAAYLQFPGQYELYAKRHGLAARQSVWPFAIFVGAIWLQALVATVLSFPQVGYAIGRAGLISTIESGAALILVMDMILLIPAMIRTQVFAINRLANAPAAQPH
jgi:hypothetical protein